MLSTVEAILAPNGVLKFLEPVPLDNPQRVLVTFISPTDETLCGLALSEHVLADDWSREEEDEAWAHLQAGK
jgi:predicted DNA-binding antitoxin AbrB/MazE fold protein